MQAPFPQFAKMVILRLALLGPVLALAVAARGQTIPDAGATAGFGSVNTPRPINPASDTTNPSARATQNLNPYLGSTPNGEVAKTAELHLSLEDAIGRGLKYNLGLIDSQEASSDARAQREHALAALLPADLGSRRTDIPAVQPEIDQFDTAAASKYSVPANFRTVRIFRSAHHRAVANPEHDTARQVSATKGNGDRIGLQC